jgi:hypothetical protein
MLINLFFILLTALASGVLIMFLSPLWIPDDIGLAGGATVIMYGLLGVFLGLIGAIALRNQVGPTTKKWIIGILTIGLVGIIWYVMVQMGNTTSPPSPVMEPTQPR